MRVQVFCFASCRDIVGWRAADLEVPVGATVAVALEAMVREHPGLQGLLPTLQVAVNEEYAERSKALVEGDELALIPPVSGGGPVDLFRIVECEIPPDALHDVVREPSDGAVVTFSGVVRDHSGETPTSFLEYEAYAPMAERKMAELAQEARDRWPVGRIAILHRVGRLEIGAISVLIGVASPHRAEAFAACAFLIDRFKEVVPVWKKEVGPGGQYWVEGPRESATQTRR